MAIFVPLLWIIGGLGTATVADNKLNEGKGMDWVVGAGVDTAAGIGSSFAKKTEEVVDDKIADTLEKMGVEEDSFWGQAIQNNWGKLSGLVGLWMMPKVPQTLKMLGTAAFIAYAVYDYIKGWPKNDFNDAAPGRNERHNVLEKGFDPDDPDLVVQSTKFNFGFGDGPELEPEPV